MPDGPLLVFLLLALDAVLPVGGELPMLLSGAAASGALGHGTSLLGAHVAPGAGTYAVLAGAGTLGTLAGAVAGWAAGRRGGRALVARHGRWIHLGPGRMAAAERWFARRGRAAVLLGRVTPLVRSFVAVAAGVLEAPFASFAALTAIGAAVWCFGLAGIGWALGDRWQELHHAFRYVEAGAGLVVAAAVLRLVLRRRTYAARP